MRNKFCDGIDGLTNESCQPFVMLFISSNIASIVFFFHSFLIKSNTFFSTCVKEFSFKQSEQTTTFI